MSWRFFSIVASVLLALLALATFGIYKTAAQVSALSSQVQRLEAEKKAANDKAKADTKTASERHARELKQAKDQYDAQKIEDDARHALDMADAERLRQQSDSRADLYRSQARSGSAAAAALADHAAKLDASLAEGREVAFGLRRDIAELHALLILAKADADATRRAVGQ